jgi:hypothetical protein
MPRCGQSSAVRRYHAVNPAASIAVADAGRDLPLPKPFKGTILASKPRHLANVGLDRLDQTT